MLARAIARHREIAVRLSIGASRGRVVRQLLTEGLPISLLAGVVSLALTAWVTRAGGVMFLSTLPPSFSEIIRLAPMGIDWRVFTFALLVSAASAVLFALIPAVQGSRLSLTTALRGCEAGSLKSSRFRSGLIVGQVSVSVLLVVTALTFTRSGLSLGSVDLGYEIGGVVSVTPRAEARALLPQMVSVVAADPRVTALAATGGNPLKGRAQHRRVAAAPDDGNAATVTWYTFASPEYFTLLHLPIERGRSFTADEAKGAAPIAIISAATAAALWPGRDPIGQAMRLESLSAPNLTRSAQGDPAKPDAILSRYSTVTVVGVTRAVVSGFLTDVVDLGHIYLRVSSHHPLATAVLLRGRTDYDLSPAVMQELFSRVGADPQAFETIPVQELRDVQLYPLRAASLLGSLLGATALALSVSGLYGVLTYNVNQRRREIGIRMALGATAGIVVRLVMRQMVRLAVFGTAIGFSPGFHGTADPQFGHRVRHRVDARSSGVHRRSRRGPRRDGYRLVLSGALREAGRSREGPARRPLSTFSVADAGRVNQWRRAISVHAPCTSLAPHRAVLSSQSRRSSTVCRTASRAHRIRGRRHAMSRPVRESACSPPPLQSTVV
jgi:predicted permease